MRTGDRSLWALTVVLIFSACGEPLARPQTVLYVNTDVPVPVLADTLRIDVLDRGGTAVESRTYVKPDPSDWPVSIGVVDQLGAVTRLRLRLYGASHVAGRNPSELPEGLAPDDPHPSYVIDRIVDVEPPTDGVRYLEVILSGDCIGVPADIVSGLGCVQGEGPTAGPTAGLILHDDPLVPGSDSMAGSWEDALTRDCVGAPRTGSGDLAQEVCIPGGVFFLGDERIGAYVPVGSPASPIPERLVRLSPFFADRYEVSVGRFRRALADGLSVSGEWLPHTPTDPDCTFVDDGANDALPMNCVSRLAAMRFCEQDGGRSLPSEAQWEYVASGRGEERMYSWGDRPPDCMSAAVARIGDRHPSIIDEWGTALGSPAHCWDELERLDSWESTTQGPAPVGTYARDRTRDGVVDISGNVDEWTLDSLVPLTHDCWLGPSLRDPVCTDDRAPPVVRGGTWGDSFSSLPSSRRVSRSDLSADTGFRCVRPAG